MNKNTTIPCPSCSKRLGKWDGWDDQFKCNYCHVIWRKEGPHVRVQKVLER